jgi:glucose dehydrogenase
VNGTGEYNGDDTQRTSCIEAIDPETGKTVWVQEHAAGEQLRGQPMRGIAFWRDRAGNQRLLTVGGQYLMAIELKTGRIIRCFGAEGCVDLVANQGTRARSYSWTSSPQICNDVVILGSSMSDSRASSTSSRRLGRRTTRRNSLR